MEISIHPTRTPEPRKLVTRGVSYPSMSLPEALEASRTFFAAERKAAAPVSSAMAHFGYAESSSGGRSTISALIQFGLLEDEGRKEDRHVRLSNRALAVILSEDDSPERREALIDCVKSPRIYREIFDKWHDGLPSDQTISFYLQREKNFNPKAIASFVKDLRDSLSFLGVEQPGELDVRESQAPVLPRSPTFFGGGAPSSTEVTTRLTSSLPTLVEQAMPTPASELQQGEKEWLRGSLSKYTEYRVLIKGSIDAKQIARLIKLLEAQKSVLEDDDDEL